MEPFCINKTCIFRSTCYSAIVPPEKSQRYFYGTAKIFESDEFPVCYSYSTEEEQKKYREAVNE